MRILADAPLRPGWAVSKIQPPQVTATFFVKGTWKLTPGKVEPSDDPDPPMGDVEIEGKGLRYASDFAPMKLRPEVLLAGTCHAPGGKPATAVPVTFKVGVYVKSLTVLGNRTWKRGLLGRGAPSDPLPFVKMPLTWDLAPGSKANPVGRGRNSDEVPNFEPGCFAPIAPTWPARASKVGTYKAKWLKERWPWFPEDFDWSYFNAAPEDQQLETPLRGDEELYLENLVASHPRLSTKLPGVRVRLFVEDARFREVPVKLDTLWVDTDAEKLVLVWRGMTPVQSLKLKEVRHLLIVAEPPVLQDAQAELAKRLAPEVELDEPEEPSEITPEQEAAMDKEIEQVQQSIVAIPPEAAKAEADLLAELKAEGLDIPKPGGPANVTAALADLSKEIAEFPELKVQLPTVPEPEPFQMEDEPDEPEWTRERVQAARGASFAEQDLSELDLSGLDFSGMNFAGATLSRANLTKCKFAGADLTEATLTGAKLEDADLTEAKLDLADFTQTALARAKLTGASVVDATFSEADLQQADLTRISGRGCSFWKANLQEARLASAKLPAADFSQANLAKVDLSNAELQAASVEGAQGPGVTMEGADLTGLHGSEAPDFTGGNFRKVHGSKSIWQDAKLDKADFSQAALDRSDFSGASLKGANFRRADMRSAVFDDADLQGAVLLHANVCRGSFERADLRGADLQGSNLYSAEFWDAITEGANLADANLKMTKLADGR